MSRSLRTNVENKVTEDSQGKTLDLIMASLLPSGYCLMYFIIG